MSDDRCGTDAGWQAHYKRGETACAFCKSARADYMRKYRADPDKKRRNDEARRARNEALKALGHRYNDEYQRLYVEALAEIRGIPIERGAA